MAVRRVIAIFFWAASAFIPMAGASFMWLLKDGLGPGEVDSHGWAALTRFAQGMWEIAGFYLVPLLVGGLIYPWRHRKAA